MSLVHKEGRDKFSESDNRLLKAIVVNHPLETARENVQELSIEHSRIVGENGDEKSNRSRRSEHVNQLPSKNVDEGHGDYQDEGIGDTENVSQDNVRHISEQQTGEQQTNEQQTGEQQTTEQQTGEQQAVEQHPYEQQQQQQYNRVPYEKSFKVARSSENARDMVRQWVNRALDMGVPRLVQEFKNNLARWRPEGMTVQAFLANRDKNRYLDVPCQDARRVIVNWPGLPNDYIHANYVANPTTDNRFICTQGPLDNTQLAFWAMVVQQRSEAIIMLCNIIECGKYKCSQYWPREKGESLAFGEGLGKITVTNVDAGLLSETDPFVRVCRLKVDFVDNGMEASSMVRHFQWENWPDRGVPPTKLTATNILSEVRGTKRPIVVHCSAGIGRTGTIVAIAYVQEKMQYGMFSQKCSIRAVQSCTSSDLAKISVIITIGNPSIVGQPVVDLHLDTHTKDSLLDLCSIRCVEHAKANFQQYIYVHRVLLAYFLEKYRDRFAQLLEGDGEAKYAKWREEYKMFTGCD